MDTTFWKEPEDERHEDAVMALWRLRKEARAALVAVGQTRRW